MIGENVENIFLYFMTFELIASMAWVAYITIIDSFVK